MELGNVWKFSILFWSEGVWVQICQSRTLIHSLKRRSSYIKGLQYLSLKLDTEETLRWEISGLEYCNQMYWMNTLESGKPKHWFPRLRQLSKTHGRILLEILFGSCKIEFANMVSHNFWLNVVHNGKYKLFGRRLLLENISVWHLTVAICAHRQMHHKPDCGGNIIWIDLNVHVYCETILCDYETRKKSLFSNKQSYYLTQIIYLGYKCQLKDV